jgi:hypothetical protein
MNNLIISEINRLNELMNLPLIMEGPGDGLKALSKYVKDILKLTEPEIPSLRKFLEGGLLIGDEKNNLRAFIKRESGEDIIKSLETKANSLSGAEKTEAIGKVNELKALRNDVHIGDDLLKIQEFKHLSHDAQIIFGKFEGYISPKSLQILEDHKLALKNQTLTDDQYLKLGDACLEMGQKIDNYLAKFSNLPSNKKEALEKGSKWYREVGDTIKNNPKEARKKLWGWTGLGFSIVAVGLLIKWATGAYVNACNSFGLGWLMKLGGLCDSNNGGGSNNGGTGKYD